MPSPRRALLNLLVFLLLAAWYIFTRDVYPQKAGRAVILGRPSVSLSVCCSLGEERGCGCWPLAQTGVELLAQLPLWLMQQHSCNITSPLMWQEKKNCWLLLFHLNLCFEGCTFRKYEFKSSKIKLSTWHLDLLCLQTEVWSQAEYPTLITKVITTGHYRKGNITFWYTHCWLENLCQHVKISCSYCCKLEAGLAQKDGALFPVCVSNQSILTQLFPFCHHFVVVACKYLFSAKTDFKNFSRYDIWNQ